ncbi:cytochrome P450 315a1, mitochondrial [Diorhabda carinulata]|uniref:cytochrome P450 315a1, mitochondrial n=1 Tax=Diorhabda carinulata TaxID=1163345 RepID=UPI0025A2AFD5|nr:cytochrome P450 315a1, mitochondrial [Diorhabda carinulata]
MFVKKITTTTCSLIIRRKYCSVKNFEDIPSTRGLPLIGSTFSLVITGGLKKLHKYIDRRHNKLGPIFRDNVGPVTAVFLSDPDEMRAVFAKEGKYPKLTKPSSWLLYNEKNNYSRGLFFMEGEEWHHFRRIMNKLLLKGDFSWIETSCDAATSLLIDRINPNEEFKNLEAELYKWSLEVIVSVLIGGDNYKRRYEEIENLVDRLSSTVNLIFKRTSELQLIPAELALKLNLKRWRNFEESVKRSLNLANDLIDRIRNENDGLINKMKQENINNKDLDRIIIDLIISAGDTTSYTMIWILFLMAKHKNHQTKLRQTLRSDPKTNYSKNIVRESLRLYPVAPFLTRVLPEDAVICGYNVPAGTAVVMSVYTSGRNGKYFKRPDVFLPERWDRGGMNDSSVRQASLPFSMGPRSCVGKKIAEIQLTVTLSKLIENFNIDVVNDEEIDDVLVMVPQPSKPLRLIFRNIT